MDDDTLLATFDPGIAAGVLAVLRDAGVPAWVLPEGGESAVHVPRERRDEAFAVLSARMEQVREQSAAPSRSEADDADDDETGRPLVMERFRDWGLVVAAVLAPLLVVTLAAPQLPLLYALAVFVGGLVAVTWWRNRDRDDDR